MCNYIEIHLIILKILDTNQCLKITADNLKCNPTILKKFKFNHIKALRYKSKPQNYDFSIKPNLINSRKK